MRKEILIIGNWKCNPLRFTQAQNLCRSIVLGLRKEAKKNRTKQCSFKTKNKEQVRIVICPPFVYINDLVALNKKLGANLEFGAQNCFWEESGAYTGEISPKMVKSLGCRYVIVGHSERRLYFNETNEIINKKLKISLRVGLTPILCIGESKKDEETGKTEEILKIQLQEGLKGVENGKLVKNLIIAYEPVWAIGTGDFCDPEKASKALFFIRQRTNAKVLYGGSVNSKIAGEYLKVGFDGLLIGGASLKAQEFIKIIKNV